MENKWLSYGPQVFKQQRALVTISPEVIISIALGHLLRVVGIFQHSELCKAKYHLDILVGSKDCNCLPLNLKSIR